MDITERYRTREPPKEHEEAVRMLLESIAGKKEPQESRFIDNSLKRRNNNLKNGSNIVRDYDRGSLKTISSSTASSSGTNNSNNNNNIGIKINNSDATSTTTTSSTSMVSKSTSVNDDDETDLLATINVGYKDPIPSRTIAVQCDLKLSSIKKDNLNGFFDSSMQASSISSTKYGFYNFSQEVLDQRRRLQFEEEERDKEEFLKNNNNNSHFKKKVNSNQIETPTSMSELSSSSCEEQSKNNNKQNKFYSNQKLSTATTTTTTANKLNSKFSSSAYKISDNNSNFLNNKNNYDYDDDDDNFNKIKSTNRLPTNRSYGYKNGNGIDLLPQRPMTALSYVSNTRLRDSNRLESSRNRGYNYNDDAAAAADSSCDDETFFVNVNNQSMRPIKNHQRAISQQALSSTQPMVAKSIQEPSFTTQATNNGRLFRQASVNNTNNKASGFVDSTTNRIINNDDSCSDCDLETNNNHLHSHSHSHNNDNNYGYNHNQAPNNNYRLPCSEEMVLTKRGHSLPYKQQQQQQQVLNNYHHVVDDDDLNRTLTRSSGQQKQNRIQSNTLTRDTTEYSKQQQINPNKRFNSMQKFNRDYANDELTNKEGEELNGHANYHYSGDELQQQQQQQFVDNRRFDVRSRSMYSKNPLVSRSLSRNQILQNKENIQINNNWNDVDYNEREDVNQNRIHHPSYLKSSSIINGTAQQIDQPNSNKIVDNQLNREYLTTQVVNKKNYSINHNRKPAAVARSTSMRQINLQDEYVNDELYNDRINYNSGTNVNNNNLNYDINDDDDQSYIESYKDRIREKSSKRIIDDYDNNYNNFSDSPSTKTWSNPSNNTRTLPLNNHQFNINENFSDNNKSELNRKASRSYSMRNVNTFDNLDSNATLTRKNQNNEMIYNYNNNNNNNNQINQHEEEEQQSSLSSSSSLEQAQRFVRSPPLDFDSQHRLNESGLPEVNSILSSTNDEIPIVLGKQTHYNNNNNNNNNINNNNRPSAPSSYIGLNKRNLTDNININNNNNINRSNTIGRLPQQITGRAMSQQSLTRPTMPLLTNGRRISKKFNNNSGNNSGSDVGGSSMSLVSRLNGRYENAHTRNPVIMYIPQVNPKQQRIGGSSSSLINAQSKLKSSSSTGINNQLLIKSNTLRKSVKSSKFKSSSQDKLKRSGSSYQGSDSEASSSSMLRTLVKPRVINSSSRSGSRRSQNNRLINQNNNNNSKNRLNNHDGYDEEDMDGVGQLVTEMEGYKFKRRYSVPKDAKINWFAKLKQKVSSSGSK